MIENFKNNADNHNQINDKNLTIKIGKKNPDKSNNNFEELTFQR